MEKQTYTEEELFNKIIWIENNYVTKNIKLEYDILIENDRELQIIEFIKNNISEHLIRDYDMAWKFIYNDILIVIDIEHHKLYLHYIENEINEDDINIIINSFLFLQPESCDEKCDLDKINLYLDKDYDENTKIKEGKNIKSKFCVEWKNYVTNRYHK
jgi:hypothetical protein